MSKIVISKQNPRAGRRPIRLRMKRVRDSSGSMVSVPVIDSNDPDFGLKLEEVFRRNVARVIGKPNPSAKKPGRAKRKR